MKKLLLILLCLPMIGFGQSSAKDYFVKGSSYEARGKYQLAIDNFTRAIEIDSDFTAALSYYNRGLVYHKLKKYEDAISDYSRAIRINPNYSEAYISRGMAKSLLDLPYCSDYAEACKIIQNLSESNEIITKTCAFHNSCISTSYVKSGFANMELKKYKEAIVDFTRAIEISDLNNPIIYAQRAIAKERLGLPYCGDFKKACEFGEERCCEKYNKDCK